MIDCFQMSLSGFINNSNIKNCLLGDFNVPGYKWSRLDNYSFAHGFHKNHNIRDAAYILLNRCKLYVVKQCCVFQNISGNILDLLFTNFVE